MSEKLTVRVGMPMISAEHNTKIGEDDSRLTQELIYLGQDGSRFHLGYREFGNGSARHAFNEDAIYQNPATSLPAEIAFRNARAIVYSVSNTGIEFEVVSGTDKI